METKNIKNLVENYEINLDKIADKIKAEIPKSVLLQFPDGLKPYATSIADYLQERFPKVFFKIWLGSCYGACDVPKTDDDFLIQFGHAEWK